MKNCPNCYAEMEENFDLCWSCNYSFSEQKVVDIKDLSQQGSREIECLRCNVPMLFSGTYKFLEGPMALHRVFQNRENFELYLCPKCGKVEFFSPVN